MHGPIGAPGVSANTTNDVMIIWIEGDAATSNADLAGGAGSQGNWLIDPSTGEPLYYPICNPTQANIDIINTNYAIPYFPIIYEICPDRNLKQLQPSFNGTNFDNNANQVYSEIACTSPTQMLLVY